MKPIKKIFLSIAFFAFTMTASAQVERRDDQQNEELEEKLQQEPPRGQQDAIDNAARQADVNAKANKNERENEEKIKKEKERSTGKETQNPAETNPKTVKPVKISDPVSAPPNSGNR